MSEYNNYYKIAYYELKYLADEIRNKTHLSSKFPLSTLRQLVGMDEREPVFDAHHTTFLRWDGTPLQNWGDHTDYSVEKLPTSLGLPMGLQDENIIVGDNLLCSYIYKPTSGSVNSSFAYIKVMRPQTTITLKCDAQTIDWGDNTITAKTGTEKSFSHTYNFAGNYKVGINGATTLYKDFCLPYSALWRLHTNGVKALEDNALQYQANLNVLTLSASLQSIGDNCFLGVPNLNALVIPNECSVGKLEGAGIGYICGSAYSWLEPNTFKNNQNLKLLNFSTSTTTVAENCLSGCSALKRIRIPEACEKIGAGAFNGCRALEAVEIPASVSIIGPYAFQNCHGLQYIRVRATTPPTLQDSQVFKSNFAAPIYVPRGTINTYKNATNWILYSDRLKEDDFDD